MRYPGQQIGITGFLRCPVGNGSHFHPRYGPDDLIDQSPGHVSGSDDADTQRLAGFLTFFQGFVYDKHAYEL